MRTGTTTMITLFAFSFRDGSWWEGEIANTNILPVCALAYRESTWDHTLTLGSRNGSFYELDDAATTDATTAFAASWTSKEWDSLQVSEGKVETMKMHQIAIHSRSGKITVKTTCKPTLDGTEPGTAQVSHTKLVFNGKSEKFVGLHEGDRFNQIQLVWDMASAASVEGMTLHLQPRGMVKH